MKDHESASLIGIAVVSAVTIATELGQVSRFAELDTEISRLQQARNVLTDAPVERGPGRPPANSAIPKKKRNLSPEGRARIAEAVKRRWANQKKSAK